MPIYRKMRKSLDIFTRKGKFSVEEKNTQFDYSDEEYEQMKNEWEKSIDSLVHSDNN